VEDHLLECRRGGDAITEAAADALNYQDFKGREVGEDMLEKLSGVQDHVTRVARRIGISHGSL